MGLGTHSRPSRRHVRVDPAYQSSGTVLLNVILLVARSFINQPVSSAAGSPLQALGFCRCCNQRSSLPLVLIDCCCSKVDQFLLRHLSLSLHFTRSKTGSSRKVNYLSLMLVNNSCESPRNSRHTFCQKLNPATIELWLPALFHYLNGVGG